MNEMINILLDSVKHVSFMILNNQIILILQMSNYGAKWFHYTALSYAEYC